MWEIGKTLMILKEFDRTVDYIMIQSLPTRISIEQVLNFIKKVGSCNIRRGPIGIVLCLGPITIH